MEQACDLVLLIYLYSSKQIILRSQTVLICKKEKKEQRHVRKVRRGNAAEFQVVRLATLLKRKTGIGAYLWILRSFSKYLFIEQPWETVNFMYKLQDFSQHV